MRKIVYQSQNLETHLDRSNHYSHHQKTSNNSNNSSFHPLSLLSFYPFFHTASISTSIVLTPGPLLCNLPPTWSIKSVQTIKSTSWGLPNTGNKIMTSQQVIPFFFIRENPIKNLPIHLGNQVWFPPPKMGPIWYGFFFFKQQHQTKTVDVEGTCGKKHKHHLGNHHV